MTNEDTSTYTGDWISWFAGLCNTTFITVEDFYSCVETQHLYTKQEIVFNHSSFSFVTARPVGLFNITWEDFIESLGKFMIIHFTHRKKININFISNNNLHSPSLSQCMAAARQCGTWAS